MSTETDSTMSAILFPTVQIAHIGEVDVHSVDGREHHSKLEVKTRFRDWWARRKEEAQLTENVDFEQRSILRAAAERTPNILLPAEVRVRKTRAAIMAAEVARKGVEK